MFRKIGTNAGNDESKGEEETGTKEQVEHEDELQKMTTRRGTIRLRARSNKGTPFYFRVR